MPSHFLNNSRSKHSAQNNSESSLGSHLVSRGVLSCGRLKRLIECLPIRNAF